MMPPKPPAAGANAAARPRVPRVWGATHLVLVRHGQSELNAANLRARIYCGQIETPLTELGLQQAELAGLRLLELDYLSIRRAVSSPLARARHTLDRILDCLSAPIERLPPAPELMERSHGVFEGRSEEEVFRDHPHYRDDPNYCHFMNHFEQCAPGGENLATVAERSWRCIERLITAGAGDLLVVSHYNTIRCLIGKALDLPRETVLQMRIANAAPIVLRFGAKRELVEGHGVLGD
jgi:broad specificity phosphatase PhoE